MAAMALGEGILLDHDAWISGMIAAAGGRGGPEARAVLSVRDAVDVAVAAMPRRLARSPRGRASTAVATSEALLPYGADLVHAILRAAKGRLSIDVSHGASRLALTLEPYGRAGRVGVLRSIHARTEVARGMLIVLSTAWGAFDDAPSRAPDVHHVAPRRSTTPGRSDLMTMECN